MLLRNLRKIRADILYMHEETDGVRKGIEECIIVFFTCLLKIKVLCLYQQYSPRFP